MVTIVITLLMAVILTERAKSPLANKVTKLEEVPPGQAANKIIPIAIKLEAQKNKQC